MTGAYEDQETGERRLAKNEMPDAPATKAAPGSQYSRMDRAIEAMSMQAETIAAQAETIRTLAKDGVRGKAAFDAMMIVAIKLGINPMPTDAEAAANAILAAFGAAPIERQEL